MCVTATIRVERSREDCRCGSKGLFHHTNAPRMAVFELFPKGKGPDGEGSNTMLRIDKKSKILAHTKTLSH